ncbi:MAG TPA: hypothetical protein VGW12_19780 [Pyrinomonadaceae bacterium]|nr:hypothetical protein [Pyrinomonadaceae bacterium]
MAAKKSQRNAAFLLFGVVAAVYLFNFVVFNLMGEGQLRAGGLGLCALGLLWLYLLGTPETLSCDRIPGACRLVKPRFLLTSKQVVNLPLARVRDVRINETYVPSHDGPGRKGYEVCLETDDGRTHVFTTTHSKQRADETSARIRSFLKDETQRSLRLRKFPWALDATGAVFILLGLLLLVGGVLR